MTVVGDSSAVTGASEQSWRRNISLWMHVTPESCVSFCGGSGSHWWCLVAFYLVKTYLLKSYSEVEYLCEIDTRKRKVSQAAICIIKIDLMA